MAINRTPMIDDDGSGQTGTIINNAWKVQLYDEIDAAIAAAGTWIDVPYSAANFTATAPAIWTVEAADQVTYAYLLNGKAMTLALSLIATSLDVAAASVSVKIPAGKQVARNHHAWFRVQDNLSKERTGLGYVYTADPTHLSIQMVDPVTGTMPNFPAGGLVVQGTITFSVT